MANLNTLSCPVLGLNSDWPERLIILQHAPSEKYGCYCHDGVHGLAAFSLEEAALRFVNWVDLGEMMIVSVTFDEAREIAKARPMPVISLVLLDSLEKPEIHFVR